MGNGGKKYSARKEIYKLTRVLYLVLVFEDTPHKASLSISLLFESLCLISRSSLRVILELCVSRINAKRSQLVYICTSGRRYINMQRCYRIFTYNSWQPDKKDDPIRVNGVSVYLDIPTVNFFHLDALIFFFRFAARRFSSDAFRRVINMVGGHEL